MDSLRAAVLELAARLYPNATPEELIEKAEVFANYLRVTEET